jgi:membrane fusion protein, multidrug efflux system
MKKNHFFRNIEILAITFVAVVFLTSGCSGTNHAKVANGVPILVAKAIATNVPVQIDPPPVGHVAAFSTVTVHSQIQGMIREIHFQEGQEVKRGDLLFTIDPRPSQAALGQAQADLQRDEAQLEYARINFAREQKLFQQKLISQDELDTNEASMNTLLGTVAADKASITNALLNLDYCEIRSPINGKTGGLQSFVGNVVKAPDDTLLTITQIHPIYVEFAVPEQYLPEIKKRMRREHLAVKATYENLDTASPQGELTFIDNSVDTTTGTILLKATFANTNNVLWPGQFVQVTLTLSELTNAVVVPSQAIQNGQDGPFVYVVKPDPTNAENQVVENRQVTTGITYENLTVIKKGVQRGETVVTDGQLRLAPGVKVTIKSSLQPVIKNSFSNAPPATNAP